MSSHTLAAVQTLLGMLLELIGAAIVLLGQPVTGYFVAGSGVGAILACLPWLLNL